MRKRIKLTLGKATRRTEPASKVQGCENGDAVGREKGSCRPGRHGSHLFPLRSSLPSIILLYLVTHSDIPNPCLYYPFYPQAQLTIPLEGYLSPRGKKSALNLGTKIPSTEETYRRRKGGVEGETKELRQRGRRRLEKRINARPGRRTRWPGHCADTEATPQPRPPGDTPPLSTRLSHSLILVGASSLARSFVSTLAGASLPQSPPTLLIPDSEWDPLFPATDALPRLPLSLLFRI